MSLSPIRGLSILAGAGLMLVAAPASADVELAPLVVIDFSEFDGSGFDAEPMAGQLDSDDWSVTLSGAAVLDFGESAGGAGSDFARGTGPGGVDDPGIWAFDVDGAGLIGLGVQPTDQTFTPGQITLRLANNTGAEVTEFQLEYTIWVNNDQNRTNSFNLVQSADNAAFTAVGDPFESPGPLDKDGFTATDVTVVVTPEAAIADATQYYIAWTGDDVAGAGVERDEFAVEGITIRLLNVCGNGLMERDEMCDDGLDNVDTGACTTTCTTAACGDGFVQDGVEECDDMNTEDGDGCAADCTVEETGTDTDTDSGTDSDTDGSGTAEGSGSDTDVTTTTPTTTTPTTTSPTTTSASGGSESDTDSGGEDEEDSGCACRTSNNTGAPLWGMLGLLGLGLARRRRR